MGIAGTFRMIRELFESRHITIPEYAILKYVVRGHPCQTAICAPYPPVVL